VKGLAELARKTKVGPATDPETQLGPINNKMQLERVMGLVDDAKKGGAKIEAGGVRLESSGYFYPPTIVTNVGPGVRLVDEEQFGTALPVMKYTKVQDAIAQANATHYGLGGSIWTSNLEKGTALAQELESGTAWVNHHMDITPYAPFGGAKWSGIGHENGRWGYEAFTELQVVNTKKR
jgi:acyl-CoA reductase-like NAD-dependent aldehyde dehydrogenase